MRLHQLEAEVLQSLILPRSSPPCSAREMKWRSGSAPSSSALNHGNNQNEASIMHHPVPFCALEAQNDVWKQIVPHGHRLFRKHDYGADMMRCHSPRGPDGCSRALAHLQRPTQVVQLSEQLESILSHRLPEIDSLSARSVVDALFGAHYAIATRLAWPNFDREWMKVFVRGTKAKRSAILCICYIWRHSHSGNLLGANTRKRPPA